MIIFNLEESGLERGDLVKLRFVLIVFYFIKKKNKFEKWNGRLFG